MPRFHRELLCAFAVAAAFMALSARQVRDEYLLDRHAQTTEAVVISKRSGHGWIEYRYTAAGHTHEGSAPALATGKPIDEVRVGDRFEIRFDPTHPDVSGTEQGRQALSSSAPMVLLALLVLFLGVVIREVVRRRAPPP